MIPFLDLQAQYRPIGAEIEEAVIATLRSGNYILGEAVTCFEENYAAFCGTRHAIATSTGTSALHLALIAAGIGPGDEVITTPATFVATTAAILYAGARPVFVDIDPETWCLDPTRIAPAITRRTKAILPVHLHGRLADMEAIGRIADAYGLTLIEDAAQAHGARRDGKRAGSFGAMGCFSFYPGKNLGAAGEGGAITTDDDALADRIRCLRDWGQMGKGVHVLRGFNYRMDSIQGAVLDIKLRHLEAWTEARRAVANKYHAALEPWIARARGPFGEDHAGHVYAITVPRRDQLRDELARSGVPTGVHYATPVHLQAAYANLGYGPGDFPVAEAFAAATLSLPIYPELSDADIDRVTTAVNLLAGPPIPTRARKREAAE